MSGHKNSSNSSCLCLSRRILPATAQAPTVMVAAPNKNLKSFIVISSLLRQLHLHNHKMRFHNLKDLPNTYDNHGSYELIGVYYDFESITDVVQAHENSYYLIQLYHSHSNAYNISQKNVDIVP